MTAHIIDGRAMARELSAVIEHAIDHLGSQGTQVCLATVRVGADYGSGAYERKLSRLANEVGIAHRPHALPGTATQVELTELIAGLNDDRTVSAILVFRPLPAHIDERAVFSTIRPEKDIEAVHPDNAGLLVLGRPRFVPSTAASVFHLLDRWLDGVGEHRATFYHRSHILVVGRSATVGKPCVSLGHEREASVQSIDEWASRTGQFGRYTRQADVLVVAAGRSGLIRAEHVNADSVVIDVGINPVRGADGRVRTVGDVDFASVAPRARAITPVPGGVGPVTDVWLMRNAVAAAANLSDVPGTVIDLLDRTGALPGRVA